MIRHRAHRLVGWVCLAAIVVAGLIRPLRADTRLAEYDYFPGGLLQRITYPNGVVTGIRYWNNGWIREIVSENSRTGELISCRQYDYDCNGNCITLREWAATPAQRRLRPDWADQPMVSTFEYDILDRLKSATYPDGRKIEYAYDRTGNRTAERETLADGTLIRDRSFVIDGQGQLVRVIDYLQAFHSMTYEYDAAGLVTARITGPLDPDGVIRQEIYRVTYQWDGWRRLRRVSHQFPGEKPDVLAEFSYDENGRRMRADTTPPSSAAGSRQSHLFVYDEKSVLEERVPGDDGSTRPLRRNIYGHALIAREDYFYGPPPDQPAGYSDSNRPALHSTSGSSARGVRSPDRWSAPGADGASPTPSPWPMDKSWRDHPDSRAASAALDIPATVTWYYHQDALGSTVAVTGTEGQLTSAYLYDAWGNFRTLDRDGQPLDSPDLDADGLWDREVYLDNLVAAFVADDTRITFTGQRLDPSLDLYDFRARMYDPELGRFLSPDPLPGDPATPPSLQRYLYAYGNPLRYIDPTGELTQPGHVAQSHDAFMSFQGYNLDDAFCAEVKARTWWIDIRHWNDPRMHFDGMDFREIVTNYYGFVKVQDARETDGFGNALHAIQDLYAHSNYVELYVEAYENVTPESIQTFEELMLKKQRNELKQKDRDFLDLMQRQLKTGTYTPLELSNIIPANPLFTLPIPWKELDTGPESHLHINKDSEDSMRSKMKPRQTGLTFYKLSSAVIQRHTRQYIRAHLDVIPRRRSRPKRPGHRLVGSTY